MLLAPRAVMRTHSKALCAARHNIPLFPVIPIVPIAFGVATVAMLIRLAMRVRRLELRSAVH
jgi:hypothetical protein